MKIEIVSADAARELVPSLTAVLADAVGHGASIGFMAGNTTEDFAAYWSAVVAAVASGQIILLVARQNEHVVGTAQVHPAGKPNQPHRADIAKVLVHSSARRQGLGEALMRAAEAAAARAGRTLLCLDTDEASAARRLYNRLGWIEIGTIPRYALMPDGNDCGSTFFYKAIG